LGNTGTQFLITSLLRLGWRRRATMLGRFLANAGRLGGAALRRSTLIRRLPLFGIPIGALANAVSMTAVGTEARNRYHPATNLPAPVAQGGGGEPPPPEESGPAVEEEPDVTEGTSAAGEEPTVTEETTPGAEETGI